MTASRAEVVISGKRFQVVQQRLNIRFIQPARAPALPAPAALDPKNQMRHSTTESPAS